MTIRVLFCFGSCIVMFRCGSGARKRPAVTCTASARRIVIIWFVYGNIFVRVLKGFGSCMLLFRFVFCVVSFRFALLRFRCTGKTGCHLHSLSKVDTAADDMSGSVVPIAHALPSQVRLHTRELALPLRQIPMMFGGDPLGTRFLLRSNCFGDIALAASADDGSFRFSMATHCARPSFSGETP